MLEPIKLLYNNFTVLHHIQISQSEAEQKKQSWPATTPGITANFY